MGMDARMAWRDGDLDMIKSYAPPAEANPLQDDAGLKIETFGGRRAAGTMPHMIRVTDAAGRSCLYVPANLDEADYVELDSADTWLGG